MLWNLVSPGFLLFLFSYYYYCHFIQFMPAWIYSYIYLSLCWCSFFLKYFTDLFWLHWVLVAACGIFTAVWGLLSSCGMWAPERMSSVVEVHCGMWDLSSLIRDQTRVPCIARQILTLYHQGSNKSQAFLNPKLSFWARFLSSWNTCLGISSCLRSYFLYSASLNVNWISNSTLTFILKHFYHLPTSVIAVDKSALSVAADPLPITIFFVGFQDPLCVGSSVVSLQCIQEKIYFYSSCLGQ